MFQRNIADYCAFDLDSRAQLASNPRINRMVDG